jgi:23S rRNA C2498 (ribose-2'-O)-methylase RlmM
MNINQLTFFAEKVKQLQHALEQVKTMQQSIEIVKEAIKYYHVLSQYLISNYSDSVNKKDLVELCKRFQEIENQALMKCQPANLNSYTTKTIL